MTRTALTQNELLSRITQHYNAYNPNAYLDANSIEFSVTNAFDDSPNWSATTTQSLDGTDKRYFIYALERVQREHDILDDS